MDPLLTSDEIAEILKVDVVTIRRLVNRQEIAAYRVGNEFRFTEADLERYLQRQRLPAKNDSTPFERLSGFMQKVIGGSGREPRLPFSKRMIRVLNLSHEMALELGHNFIGTEHLLLGLLKEDGGIAAHVLHGQGVSYEKAHEVLSFIMSKAKRVPNKDVGLTARAKKVIGLAIEEAQHLNHSSLDPEHLLLGILREGEGLACGVLKEIVGEEKYAHLWEEVVRRLEVEGVAEDVPSVVEKASAFINAQGEGQPCVQCGSLCLDTFNYCFNCGTRLEKE